MRTSEVAVTPDIAAEMLDGNLPPGLGGNRTLSQRVVDKYANDMKNGNWLDTGAPINFSDDERFKWGALQDGQHRLWAVVESGVTVTFVINQGVDPEAWDLYDNQKPRTLKDSLTRRGEVAVARLSAAVTMHYRWVRMKPTESRFGSITAPSRPEALAHLERNPGLRHAVNRAYGPSKALRLRESLGVALNHHLALIDEDAAAAFFRSLETGEGLVHGDPVFAARKWAINWIGKTGKPSSEFYMAVLIKTWNAIMLGKSVSVLSFRPGSGEAFPIPVDLDGNPFPPRDQIPAGE